MATQVDSLGSFKSFRPWRHRDNGAGGSGHSGSNSHDSHDVQDTRPDDSSRNNVRQLQDLHVVKKERPPPSQRENHRPRSTSTLLSSPPSSQSPSQRISASHPAQADVSVDIPPASPATATEPLSSISNSISTSTSTSTDDTPRTPGPIVLPRDTSPLPSPSVCPPPPPCRPSLKRRRALSDVDGPNTAALCCKKRRLRRFLITSRLSQPFSQPATHILNRESVASGDKRFLKLAAIMNARRILGSAKAPHTPVASESLRRAAMANRLRRRLYAEATAASTAGRPLTGIPLSLMANMANARFTIVPVSTAGRVPGVTTTATATATAAAAPTTPAVSVSSSAVFAPVSGSTVAKSPPLSPHRPIVRAVSRSPKLRPVKDPKVLSRLQREADYRHDRHYEPFDADDDSECTAFPASEHASATDSYEDDDDSEDVYADFSVLFSSATAGDELEDLDGLDGLDGLDDYMDELDGIAHLPR